MRSTCLFAMLLLGALAVYPAGEDAQFSDRDKAWAAAVTSHDVTALDRMFTDELIYAHSTGNIDSKKQYIDRLKSGVQKYDNITIEKSRVVPYGDAVVTHSIIRMNGTSNGKPFNDHVMMLHLWVKQGGAWRIAAHQTTKLPQ